MSFLASLSEKKSPPGLEAILNVPSACSSARLPSPEQLPRGRVPQGGDVPARPFRRPVGLESISAQVHLSFSLVLPSREDLAKLTQLICHHCPGPGTCPDLTPFCSGGSNYPVEHEAGTRVAAWPPGACDVQHEPGLPSCLTSCGAGSELCATVLETASTSHPFLSAASQGNV